MQTVIVTQVITEVIATQDYPGAKIKQGDKIKLRTPVIKKILCNIKNIGGGTLFFNAITGKQVLPLNQ